MTYKVDEARWWRVDTGYEARVFDACYELLLPSGWGFYYTADRQLRFTFDDMESSHPPSKGSIHGCIVEKAEWCRCYDDNCALRVYDVTKKSFLPVGWRLANCYKAYGNVIYWEPTGDGCFCCQSYPTGDETRPS